MSTAIAFIVVLAVLNLGLTLALVRSYQPTTNRQARIALRRSSALTSGRSALRGTAHSSRPSDHPYMGGASRDGWRDSLRSINSDEEPPG
jgi:hypothetical protein